MNLNNYKQNASKRKKINNQKIIIVHKIDFRNDGKICSPIKIQISKERQTLKLDFWQDLIGTEPTDTSASTGGSFEHLVGNLVMLNYIMQVEYVHLGRNHLRVNLQ